jgi:hypothetical protein
MCSTPTANHPGTLQANVKAASKTCLMSSVAPQWYLRHSKRALL